MRAPTVRPLGLEEAAVAAGDATGWRAAIAAGLMALASFVAIAWLQSRPQPGATEVAAVFAPWSAPERAFAGVAMAGGLVVRQGILDTILVVRGEDAGLIDRLYAAGAWAVIDPVAFGGCLVKRSDRSH
jgi:hypothetical protein